MQEMAVFGSIFFANQKSVLRRQCLSQNSDTEWHCGKPPVADDYSQLALVVFIVTRYDKSMKKIAQKRGRPRKTSPTTAAERMRAYRKRKRDAGLKNVRHWESVEGEGLRQYSDHRILDARSLAMHCKIAQKITRRPELLDKARANLRRWMDKSDGPQPHYLREWEEILERPWLNVAELITSMSEDATRLRSSSPFAGILTTEERDQIYAAFRA